MCVYIYIYIYVCIYIYLCMVASSLYLGREVASGLDQTRLDVATTTIYEYVHRYD